MQTSVYKAKSSVRRAAKAMEGFNLETLEVLQDSNGMWYGTDGWGTEEQQEIVLESNEDLETKLEVAMEEPKAEATKIEIPKVDIVRASCVQNPCKMVWEICENMKGERRSVVLNACVEHGIAYNTARTQYQQWLVATRNQENTWATTKNS